MIYVLQNNSNGSLTVISQPGIHFRLPFLTSVTTYRQVVTVTFEDKRKAEAYEVGLNYNMGGRTVPVPQRNRRSIASAAC